MNAPNTTPLPPHSIAAEQATLGAIFIEPEILHEVRLRLPTPEMFFRVSHQVIYRAMLALADQGVPIDWITVENQVRKQDPAKVDLRGHSLQDYLSEISSALPSSFGWDRYSTIVRDCWARRELLLASGEAREAAIDEARSPGEIIEMLDKRIQRIEDARLQLEIVPLGEAAAAAEEHRRQLEAWRRNNADALPGMSSGFRDVDMLTAGWRPGELVVIGARPGQGKTSLLLGVCSNQVGRDAQGIDVEAERGVSLVFSYEMSRTELTQRLICQIAGVDLRAYRMGKLSREDNQAVLEARPLLEQGRVQIIDDVRLQIPQIRAACRRVQRQRSLRCVFIDYLQLVPDDSNLDRVVQVGNISRGLKMLARELECPVITAAQLNRGVENRGDMRPRLSDLRESGSIEQDADQVLMLWCRTPEKEQAQREALDFQLLLAKNRNGPTGEVPFYFHKESARFIPCSAIGAKS